jgi:hypothetical protein
LFLKAYPPALLPLRGFETENNEVQQELIKPLYSNTKTQIREKRAKRKNCDEVFYASKDYTHFLRDRQKEIF